MRVDKVFVCLGFAILRNSFFFFLCTVVVAQGCGIPVVFISEAVYMAILSCFKSVVS